MSPVVPPAPGTRILQRPGAAPSLVLPRSMLRVVRGPDDGQERALAAGALVVGTDRTCDWVLSDEAISSRHFELLLTEQGCLARDLGSTNGTYVDGHRLGQIHLSRTARITAGETELRFEVLGGEVQIPLSRSTNFGGLLGHSPAMRAVFAVLEKAARRDVTILVLGESGTGKELAARAIHECSERRDGPYVIFDCGAASATLIESQLFGHARGAFTGAVEERVGAFEQAHGGTLVLDEIGEVPLELQPKLLRALESRTIVRVGESASRDVDLRFVACTHRNLEQEVKAGRFRQDLYFRLNVLPVRLPPLRERKEELPRLVRHFLTTLGGDEPAELSEGVVELLRAHDWPGNVRELRNFVERLQVLPEADPASLLPRTAESGDGRGDGSADEMLRLPFHDAKRRWTERLERSYLLRLIETHAGNISAAARDAGLSRQSCYRLMQKYGIRGE